MVAGPAPCDAQWWAVEKGQRWSSRGGAGCAAFRGDGVVCGSEEPRELLVGLGALTSTLGCAHWRRGAGSAGHRYGRILERPPGPRRNHPVLH